MSRKPKRIGEKIAELRKERKMTQEELAEIIGVSFQTVSKWETGVTMPDILLLPTIAGIFEVSMDELFSMGPKEEKPAAREEVPFAAYDALLDVMWGNLWNWTPEQVKKDLFDLPNRHSGYIAKSGKGRDGSVYADRNLALTYIADRPTSEKLLSSRDAAAFLQAVADPNLRKILSYQAANPGVSYTASSVSAKCKIPEEEAKKALELLEKYALTGRQTVDTGDGEKLTVYTHCCDHKLRLLLYPLLSIAETLSAFEENWSGFRG